MVAVVWRDGAACGWRDGVRQRCDAEEGVGRATAMQYFESGCGAPLVKGRPRGG